MTFTVPTTRAIDEIITAAIYNTDLVDDIAWLGTPPSCRVYRTTAQSISDSTDTVITFGSERFDTDAMHSTSSSTGRITFTTAGKYLVGAAVEFAASAGGAYRLAQFRLNGTTTIAAVTGTISSGATSRLTPVTFYSFSAGDYVELVVYQDSGGALNVNASTNYSPEFWAKWESV